ncbi:UDP-glucose 4-epimerase GalE [Xanthobacter autotrophicus]|uniref:UDP-glucose 4-epimerase GalE n=1 Tax=Xanthobacter autotrophicus TaxID=280 RepID=UPI00372BCF60
MSVLVTGGAGYIGSHTVLELIGKGETVTVLDDLSTGFDWIVSEAAELVIGDVAESSTVKRLIEERGISEIIHFAAKIVVPDSVSDPLGYYLGNTVKTRMLFETARDAGVKRIIFSSTAAVYGEPGIEVISESAPKIPINPYGRSKLMSEWMLEDVAHAHGIAYTVLRYFNVAGADPVGRSGQSSKNATHLIKVACQAAIGERLGLEIFGTDYATRDGTCVRDYIHVTDLARAHVAALDRLRCGGENLTLNCGYGVGYSVQEVVDVVKSVSGVDFPVRISPRRAGDPAWLVAGVERIRMELDWEPRINDLRAIVRHALDWESSLARRRAVQPI